MLQWYVCSYTDKSADKATARSQSNMSPTIKHALGFQNVETGGRSCDDDDVEEKMS
jgi:hypothetical protein